MDKMRNMAVKRDSVRKSFIGDPNGKPAAAGGAGSPGAGPDDKGGDDLSAYL
jgi:calcium/calmodulin-dependent protein kinase I